MLLDVACTPLRMPHTRVYLPAKHTSPVDVQRRASLLKSKS